MGKVDESQRHYAKHKTPDKNCHIKYIIYITFWNRKNYSDKNQWIPGSISGEK